MAQNNDSDDDDSVDRQQQVQDAIEANVADIFLNDPFADMTTGELSARDHGPCHRCDQQRTELSELTVNEKTRYVCDDCATELIATVDDYYWFDRFTRGHYEVIAAFLSSLDEVWCVHDNAYEGGEMFVHTGYFSSTVVSDVLDFMGSIYSVHIEHADSSCWDCIADHGDCVEIIIDFDDGSVPLNPPSSAELADILANRTTYDVDRLEERDRVFERDDE